MSNLLTMVVIHQMRIKWWRTDYLYGLWQRSSNSGSPSGSGPLFGFYRTTRRNANISTILPFLQFKVSIKTSSMHYRVIRVVYGKYSDIFI